MKNYKNGVTLEEMSYELDLMMQAMLYFAGVKREKIEEACDLYVENIDDVVENLDLQGVDEVIAVVEFLKKNHKDLF